MSLDPGTRLGPYTVEELRGTGGMGEVYRAIDTRLDRLVAIKVLPTELATRHDFKQRLTREAQAISRLQHPNVCTLYDVGATDDMNYLVMEFLEGETLETRLSKGPLAIEEVVTIGSNVCQAIEAAHRTGVVHRDLKPGNVMLTPESAKVLDFGLARSSNISQQRDSRAETALQITRTGTLVGTLPYMSPEQLNERPVDSRTDIWAIGCLLFEMATGQQPFRGSSRASLIGAILKDAPPTPSSITRLSNGELDDIVDRCLKKDPDRRWQSAAEIAESLDRIALSNRPRSQRRPWNRFGVAATTAGLLLVLLFAFLAFEGRPPDPEVLDADVDIPAEHALLAPLVVFDLENPSESPEYDVIGSAIAEEIIELHGASRPVIPLAASRAHQDKEPCIAAAELSGGYVLTGSLVPADDQLRARGSLIACPEGETIWDQNFDSPVTDTFQLVDQISGQIYRSLAPTLKAYQDGYARDRLKRGNRWWHHMQATPEDNRIAQRLFDSARDENPEIPLLWAHSSNPYWQALLFGWGDPQLHVRGMLSNAQRCLDIDANDATCLGNLAWAQLYSGQREEAIDSISRAADMAHRDPSSLALLASVLAIADRPDEAVEILDEALAGLTSPTAATTEIGRDSLYAQQALALFSAERFPEARDSARQAISLQRGVDPFNTKGRSLLLLTASLAHLGDLEGATDALKRIESSEFLPTRETIEVIYGGSDSNLVVNLMHGLNVAQAALESREQR